MRACPSGQMSVNVGPFCSCPYWMVELRLPNERPDGQRAVGLGPASAVGVASRGASLVPASAGPPPLPDPDPDAPPDPVPAPVVVPAPMPLEGFPPPRPASTALPPAPLAPLPPFVIVPLVVVA